MRISIHPDAPAMCKKNTKVLLEPVTIWVNDKSSIEKVSEEDRQMLTDYLYESLKESLSKDFEMVDRAGPDVLRVRAALTEAEGSYVILDTITTLLPIGLGVSTLKQLALGTASFVAEASIEFDLEDSLTQETLIAGVDKRAGGKGWSRKFAPWGQDAPAFDYWAEKAHSRLVSCRAGELEV